MSDPGPPPPDPAGPDAARADGRGHLAAGRKAEAEQAFRAVLASRPDDREALLALAGLLELDERPDEALAISEGVLRRDPQHGEAWLTRGDALYNLDRYGEAVESYRRAFVRRDLAYDALMRLGLAFGAMARFDLAIESLDAAVTLRPDSADARLRRGALKLKFDRFADGWDDYEARWRSERFIAASRGVVSQGMVPALTISPTAADLKDKRVLVVGEQGVGDQLMFASMIPDLAAVARSVVCVCEPRLVRLFSGSFEGVSVLSPATAQVDSDDIDVVLAMGSLGAAFRRERAAFTGAPYLRPRAEVVERWAARLGPKSKRLRVGLSWRGGVAATRRRARSLPLSALGPIFDLADCEMVSLQYGDVSGEVEALNAHRADPVRLFPAHEIDDFEELAGLVANLDVAVSVTTALVHLCGALGRECLTLVAQNPEWRYGAAGPRTPWYGSVRLFRQPAPGTWRPAIGQVAEALGSRPSPGAG